MSTKPWEQDWRTSENEGRTVETCDGWRVAEAYPASEHGGVAEQFDVARLLAAAPNMARALLAVVEGTLKCHAPVFGPLTIDEVVERGHPISITAGELGAMVAALRKAGVL